MKKTDRDQKLAMIALAIFVVFLIGFSVLSNLVQSQMMPGLTADQRASGLLAFLLFLPLCVALFFEGKHFKKQGRRLGGVLTFVSVALFAFGILQALPSLLGAYGA